MSQACLRRVLSGRKVLVAHDSETVRGWLRRQVTRCKESKLYCEGAPQASAPEPVISSASASIAGAAAALVSDERALTDVAFEPSNGDTQHADMSSVGNPQSNGGGGGWRCPRKQGGRGVKRSSRTPTPPASSAGAGGHGNLSPNSSASARRDGTFNAPNSQLLGGGGDGEEPRQPSAQGAGEREKGVKARDEDSRALPSQ